MAQATRRRSKEAPPLTHHVQRGLREAGLFVLGALALYLFIDLVSYDPADSGWTHTATRLGVHNTGGVVGAWFADIAFHLFGYLAYLIPGLVGYGAWALYRGRRAGEPRNPRHTGIVAAGLALVVIGGTGLAALRAHDVTSGGVDAGGFLGALISGNLVVPFSAVGTILFLTVLLLTGITLATGLSWLWLMDTTGQITLSLLARLQGTLADAYDRFRDWRHRPRPVPGEPEEPMLDAAALDDVAAATDKPVRGKADKADKADKAAAWAAEAPRIEPVITRLELSERAQQEKQIPLFKLSASKADGQLPPLALLDEAVPSKTAPSTESLEAMARLVELKLKDFNIEVQVTAVHPGPVITRYELQPAPGIKVSQITNLTKDLARALSVISVRVVEVIPGKSVIGLEIPNEHREVVRLSEILASKQYGDASSPLTLALGKDISGRPVVADVGAMPHLLVAGTTGSGKSVAINAMVLSLLYSATPKDVRLIMIDPKMLELSVYDGIPHLLCPVVTDMKEAANALRWCVAEMDRRYGLMAEQGVRHLSSYNRKVKEAIDKGEPIPDKRFVTEEGQDPPILEPLPYIVVLIDEFADMMMVVGKKVEDLIARLAQKARASGIHVIVATQRPSVDVITGLIKANIPTRIAFQVSSKIDSRTILDQMGAEQLLGHGDMLYLAPGTGIPMRVHGAFVADHEVHKVAEFLKRDATADYLEDVVRGETGSEPTPSLTGIEPVTDDGDGADPLYDEAVKVVKQTQRASVSGVQRRLKIGYNRAARLIEEMERAGIVGPMQSNGMRELLVPSEAAEE